MSFDDTCVKCGRHLYAYCGGETPSHDHVGWVIMGDDGAWCVGCLQDRVEELETSADLHSRMMDRARALYQAAHPGTEDRWPDGAVNVAWLVEHLEAVTRERELHAGRVRDARRAFADFLMMEGSLIDYGSNVGRETPSDAYARFLKETEEK